MPDRVRIWLCIEKDTSIQPWRITNLPGGPKHCYFTGTPKHRKGCGWQEIVIEADQDTTQEFEPLLLTTDQWVSVKGCVGVLNLIEALGSAHSAAHSLELTPCSDSDVEFSVWVGEVDGHLHVGASVAVEGVV